MSEHRLPAGSISGRQHFKSLENLVDRFEDDGEPVYYERAAIDVNPSDCSSCLKFFGDIELLNVEEAGTYIPSTYLINYFNKIGESKGEAKEKLFTELEGYEVFSEIRFQAERDDHSVRELAESVAGQIGADKDEVDKIEVFIDILDYLDIVEVDEETGIIKIISPVTEENSVNSEQEGSKGQMEDRIKSNTAKNIGEGPEETIENQLNPGGIEVMSDPVYLNIQMTMELSDMDRDETKGKLEEIQEFIQNVK